MRKKGFTLIEVIVTSVILAILAAVIIPSMANYISDAQQSSRNEKARSLFMVTQSAMTSAWAANEESKYTAGGAVDLSVISPEINADEKSNNSKNIDYIKLDKSDGGNASASLYKLIEPYLIDKTVLKDSILVEYNRLTGKVLSVFYSDVKTDLGYGAGSGYNVDARDNDSLKKGEVGYFAVSTTGKYTAPKTLSGFSAELIDHTDLNDNYGLLTLECTLPENESAYDYSIKLYGQTGKTAEIKIGAGGTAWDSVRGISSIESAFASPLSFSIGGTTVSIPTYVKMDANGHSVVVMVLDSADSSVSIEKLMPEIAGGYVLAGLTVSDSSHSSTTYSGVVDSLFGGRETVNGTAACIVKSPRHLNNIRYDAADTFVQTADIDMRTYLNKAFPFTPIVDAKAIAGAETGFRGTYAATDGTNSYVIRDLTTNGNETGGLFGRIAPNASVKGVTLDYTDGYIDEFTSSSTGGNYFINGTTTAGGIAAENAGTIDGCVVKARVTGATAGGIAGSVTAEGKISNCTIVFGDKYTKLADSAKGAAKDGYFTSGTTAGGIAGDNKGAVELCTVNGRVSASVTAGGIAGKCSGSIDKCTSLAEITAAGAGGIAGDVSATGSVNWCSVSANVTGEDNAGGIAATSAGKVTYCETGTACDKNGLAGIPYFGANTDGKSEYKSSKYETVNDVFKVSATKAGANAGGITGKATGGTTKYCTNAAAIDAPKDSESAAGGVIGYLGESGAVSDSYNAGTISGKGYSGGVAGKLQGTASSCYNTGYVNIKVTEDTEKKTWEPGSAIYSGAWNGGIAGNVTKTGTVNNSYSAQYVYGEYSGAFGLLYGNVNNCAFLANKANVSPDCVINSDGTTGVVTGLERLANDDMRGKNNMGDLNSSSDANGAGDFKYMMPYLNVKSDGCTLGEKFHRTPFTDVVQETGRIKMVEKSGANFQIRFCTNDSAFTVVIKTDKGDITIKFDAATVKTLKDNIINGQGSGAEKVTAVVTGTDGRTFGTFDVRLQKSSEEYAAGYSGEYVINCNWLAGDSYLNYMPTGAKTVSAELYSADGKTLEGVSETTLTRPESIDYAYVGKDKDGRLFIRMSIQDGLKKNTDLSARIKYKSGAEQMFSLTYSNITNAYASFSAAIKDKTKKNYVTLAGGTAKYAVYKSSSDSISGYSDYTIMLYCDEYGAGKNGIKDEPFYARFDVKKTTYYSNMYEGD